MEANIVVIAACMPTLKPVLELILVKFRLMTPSNQKYQSHSHSQGQIYASARADRNNRQNSFSKGNLSEENILSDREDLHIRRTDEVQVEYEMQAQAHPIQKRSFE